MSATTKDSPDAKVTDQSLVTPDSSASFPSALREKAEKLIGEKKEEISKLEKELEERGILQRWMGEDDILEKRLTRERRLLAKLEKEREKILRDPAKANFEKRLRKIEEKGERVEARGEAELQQAEQTLESRKEIVRTTAVGAVAAAASMAAAPVLLPAGVVAAAVGTIAAGTVAGVTGGAIVRKTEKLVNGEEAVGTAGEEFSQLASDAKTAAISSVGGFAGALRAGAVGARLGASGATELATRTIAGRSAAMTSFAATTPINLVDQTIQLRSEYESAPDGKQGGKSYQEFLEQRKATWTDTIKRLPVDTLVSRYAGAWGGFAGAKREIAIHGVEGLTGKAFTGGAQIAKEFAGDAAIGLTGASVKSGLDKLREGKLEEIRLANFVPTVDNIIEQGAQTFVGNVIGEVGGKIGQRARQKVLEGQRTAAQTLPPENPTSDATAKLPRRGDSPDPIELLKPHHDELETIPLTNLEERQMLTPNPLSQLSDDTARDVHGWDGVLSTIKRAWPYDDYAFEDWERSGHLITKQGIPSKLDREAYELVRTQDFINWAGNWEDDNSASNVILDPHTKEPKVFYRGDKSLYKKGFLVKPDEERTPEGASYDLADARNQGVFFTDNKKVALEYGTDIDAMSLGKYGVTSEADHPITFPKLRGWLESFAATEPYFWDKVFINSGPPEVLERNFYQKLRKYKFAEKDIDELWDQGFRLRRHHSPSHYIDLFIKNGAFELLLGGFHFMPFRDPNSPPGKNWYVNYRSEAAPEWARQFERLYLEYITEPLALSSVFIRSSNPKVSQYARDYDAYNARIKGHDSFTNVKGVGHHTKGVSDGADEIVVFDPANIWTMRKESLAHLLSLDLPP